MLSILIVIGVLFVFVLLLTYFTGWLLPEESSGVVNVRLTPDREIKEMTVGNFKNMARDFLSSEGYEVESNGDKMWAHKDGEEYYVEFDFEGKASNPRSINGMMVEQKKRNSDQMILFTLASVEGRARRLAERSRIRIIEPDVIIGWKRERNRS